MKTPEELDADYAALLENASAAIEASAPFVTIVWKEGVPVPAKPSLRSRLTSLVRRGKVGS